MTEQSSQAADPIVLKSVDDAPADSGKLIARQFRRNWQMLGLSTFIVVMSFLLAVRSDERVEFRFLPDWPLPDTCLMRTVTHIPCPGCGLTRSFVYFAHGDWIASWHIHKLGWLFAISTVFQIPYRSYALLTRNPAPLGVTWPKRYGTLLLILLIVHGVARVLILFWPR